MTRVALVTGANKGIGYCIVQQLLQKEKDLVVILGARNEERGRTATQQILSESSEYASRLVFHQLDIDDKASVAKCAETIQQQYGGLDILINNAAIAFKGDAFDKNVAATTINTNYYNTLHICQTFLPLLRDNGRLVNLASRAGNYTIIQSDDLKKRFFSASLTLEQLDGLMQEFIDSIGDDTYKEKGWPRTTYGVSKLGLITAIMILARDYEKGLLTNVKGKNITFSSCCPGWCKTDMSSMRGNRTAAEGAQTPVWLATCQQSECVQGGFYGEQKLLPWAPLE